MSITIIITPSCPTVVTMANMVLLILEVLYFSVQILMVKQEEKVLVVFTDEHGSNFIHLH